MSPVRCVCVCDFTSVIFQHMLCVKFMGTCSQVKGTEQFSINIGASDGWVPSGDKLLAVAEGDRLSGIRHDPE